MPERLCENCPKDVTHVTPQAYRNAEIRVPSRLELCDGCGGELPVIRSTRRWCGDACRQRGYRDRVRADKQAAKQARERERNAAHDAWCNRNGFDEGAWRMWFYGYDTSTKAVYLAGIKTHAASLNSQGRTA